MPLPTSRLPTEGPRRARRILFPHLLPADSLASTEPTPLAAAAVQGLHANPKPVSCEAKIANQAGSSPLTRSVSASSLCTQDEKKDSAAESQGVASAPLPPQPFTQRGSGSSGAAGAIAWDGLVLSPRDLDCLQDGCMLNDSVVDFFLRLTHRFLAPRGDVHMFSTHFFTRLTAAGAANGEVGWENVRSWTKRTALFAHSYALVPINSELHWWLAAVQLHDCNSGGKDKKRKRCDFQPRVAWLDSLPGEASRYEHALHFLSGYFRREWAERVHDNVDLAIAPTPSHVTPCAATCAGYDGWDGQQIAEGRGALGVVPAPQQENGIDCGVFLLVNVMRLLAGQEIPASMAIPLETGRTTTSGAAGDCSCAAAEITGQWCDQAQAARLRACLRRTTAILRRSDGASTSGAVAVPELLERRPEVLVRIRTLWGAAMSTETSNFARES